MIGVHATPSKPLQSPIALHIEVLAWFSAAIPPSSDRTVLVRISGLQGTWPAFYVAKQKTWFSTHDGAEISEPVECWAEQPIGSSNQRAVTAGDDVVARYTLTAQGYTSLKFTAAGKALPPGDYELRLGPLPFTPARSPK